MRTSVDPETGEIKGGSDFTAAQLEAMLPSLLALRRQRDDLDRAYKKAAEPVRAYLDAHPGEELRDGESGITACLQERAGGLALDVMTLAEKAPHLLTWLAVRGGLKLDATAWKAIKDKAAEAVDLKRYTYPAGGTTALIIEKEKR